jgi:hypothetical protein
VVQKESDVTVLTSKKTQQQQQQQIFKNPSYVTQLLLPSKQQEMKVT